MKLRRLLARTRARWPLLHFVPPFLLGQILGVVLLPEVVSAVGIWPPLILLGILVFGAFYRGKAVLGALCCGVLTTATYAAIPTQVPTGEASYLAEVSTSPRRPQVGAIHLTLAVLARMEKSELQPLSTQFPRLLRCTAIDLPWRTLSRVRVGDRVVVRTVLTPLQLGFNPLSFDASLRRRGIDARCRIRFASIVEPASPGWIERLRDAVRGLTQRALGDGERGGLVLAMAIGARDSISYETEEAFKRTGLAHLLVASGYQVTLLFLAAVSMGRRLFSNIPASQGLLASRALLYVSGLLFSALFVALVGPEGSALRALAAALCAVVAYVGERGGGFMNALLVSLLAVSLLWPGGVFDPGIQLTFAALAGLALGASSQGGALMKYVKACSYATIATSGVSMLWFGGVSLWPFVLNPFVAPLASLVGCKLALFATALYAAHLDSRAILLGFVADCLEVFRDFVWALSGEDSGYFELPGGVRVLLSGLVWALLAWVFVRRIRRYGIEFNLLPVRRQSRLDGRTTF